MRRTQSRNKAAYATIHRDFREILRILFSSRAFGR